VILPFFSLAMTAPKRQSAFRIASVLHALLVALLGLALVGGSVRPGGVAQTLLIAGIVEGAAIIGWRLTQLPKSQSLEFLLVSPLRPRGLFFAEAAVGLSRLALVQAVGLPVLAVWVATGLVDGADWFALLAVPWLWGSVTGLGLTVWAYEPVRVRRAAEWVGIGCILTYLIVGVLAGENLRLWLAWLPEGARWWIMEGYIRLHQWNPFAAHEYWFAANRDPVTAVQRLSGVSGVAALTAILLSARGAWRLSGHFHDRHYRPLIEVTPADPSGIRDRPLSWWAVRRVMEYSGRMNLYLAGGFGVVYAAYLVAGNAWPAWMGRMVFDVIERAGGVATVTTGLVLLAAVPAAFQYGLWDSSGPDRLRRLELLLLTQLGGRDYWDAAAAAAWRRGRGYLAIAAVLWSAAAASGRYTPGDVLAAGAAAVVLWGGYFTLGFRAFAGGYQASGLGSLLTLGLPLATFVFLRAGWPDVAAWTPPGLVYVPLAGSAGWTWAVPALVLGLGALVLGRQSRERCIADLQSWYDRHCGMKLQD